MRLYKSIAPIRCSGCNTEVTQLCSSGGYWDANLCDRVGLTPAKVADKQPNKMAKGHLDILVIEEYT